MSTVASGAVRGIGSAVRAGVGDPVVWTPIKGIENFDFPDQSPSQLDVTTLDSPGDTEEAIDGITPLVVWSVEVHYVPGGPTDELLKGLRASKEHFLLGLKAGSADERQFAGYVNGYTPKGLSKKDVMKAELKVVVMAEVTA